MRYMRIFFCKNTPALIAGALGVVIIALCAFTIDPAKEPEDPLYYLKEAARRAEQLPYDTGDTDMSLPSPAFSRESGFYDSEFYLSVQGAEGYTLRYTLDSSEVGPDSEEYREPIRVYDKSGEPNVYSDNPQISVDYFTYSRRRGYSLPLEGLDKAFVVRAALFTPDGRKGPTAAASYFVGYQEKEAYRGVRVLSLVSDPEGLFSDETGIYCIGRAGHENFRKRIGKKEEAAAYAAEHPEIPLDGSVSICGVMMGEGYVYNYSQRGMEWEREAHAAFFDANHDLMVRGVLGLRVRGHNSRNFPQKSFNLFERDAYSVSNGSRRFYFPYLNNKYSDGVCLSGGADDMYTNVRDKLAAELFSPLNFGVMEISGPIYVFLDGEFWGTYTMTEKQDEKYIEKHYGVDADNVLIVKNGLPESSTGEVFDRLFGQLRLFLLENDLSEEEAYRKFGEMVDIDSLMDYYAARLYADEGNDWPKSNTSIWRSIGTSGRPYEDGKWRFLNFDNNAEFLIESVEKDTLKAVMEQGAKDEKDLTEDYQKGSLSNSDNYKYVRYMFYCLMKNSSFRREFGRRFEKTAAVVYDPDYAIPVLETIAGVMRKPMVKSYTRWYGDRCSYEEYDRKIGEIEEFLLKRAEYILPPVRQECGL